MVEAVVAVLVTLCLCFGIILRYMPFRSMVTPRKKRILVSIYITACVLNMVIATLVFRALGLERLVDYLHTGGSLFAIALACVNILVLPGRTGEHLFVMGLVRSLHFLMMSLPAYFISLIPDLRGGEQLVLYLGLYLLTLLLTHWPLQKLICSTVEPFLQWDVGGYWNTIFFIPIAFFIAVAIFVWGTNTIDSLLQLISSMVSGGMMVLMCLSIAADHRRIHQQQIMEKQLADQQLHYAQLQVRVEDARKMNHDLKHHMAVICRYIETDDKQGLSEYCDTLVSRNNSVSDIPYTGNGAVDGVLYYYIQQAKEANIDFKYAGVIRAKGIADVDLCALLGNALDNAVTACRTVENGRSISVISQSEPMMLSIVVRNTFDGHILQSREGLLSRKRENAAGIGLKSMEDICRSYGGSLQTQWDENSFTVMFMLPLSDRD